MTHAEQIAAIQREIARREQRELARREFSMVRFWLERLPNTHEQNQQVTRALVTEKSQLVTKNDGLLDVRQAAKRLGVSAKWLYVHHKELPYVAIGGGKRPRIKFRPDDLDAWVQRHVLDRRSKRHAK